MGNEVSTKKVNFEDIQYLFKNKKKYILINTLKSDEQSVLIKNTLPVEKEEKMINEMIYKNNSIIIIVYDKNANAPNLMTKYTQLLNLGFTNVYIYPGGLFEWLCLQDIYGFENFPTTKKELDILRFKGRSIFNTFLLHDDID